MEPRATPAATRGLKPCPHSRAGTAQPDSKTETEHDNGNNPERHKHLKSLVLGTDPAYSAGAFLGWEIIISVLAGRDMV